MWTLASWCCRVVAVENVGEGVRKVLRTLESFEVVWSRIWCSSSSSQSLQPQRRWREVGSSWCVKDVVEGVLHVLTSLGGVWKPSAARKTWPNRRLWSDGAADALGSMAKCWTGSVDVERLEDVLQVSRTSWARVWTSWRVRGSMRIVIDPWHAEVNQGTNNELMLCLFYCLLG